MMIEIYLLKQLTTFARCGTLSVAADELHISQPALSRSMQKIEEKLRVKLFERRKNKIILNATGILAAERAERVLKELDDMIDKVHSFERSQHTISLGCCASVPLREFISLLSQLYPEMTITSELKTDDRLISGLCEGTYQIIVLHNPPSDDQLYSMICGHERLYLSLPMGHPFANRPEIRVQDLEGQTMLLYSAIGFWYDLCMEKMPRTKFLLQNDRDVLGELVNASEFPSFLSSFYINRGETIPGRVNIPILDPEFDVTYWCVCRSSDKEKFGAVFSKLPVKSMSSDPFIS